MEQYLKARKRVANFTSEEKALLVQLVKKFPIIETKFTDGKSVAKKKVAWESITQEFNCNSNNITRDTITLRRAWDNLRATTRKARTNECSPRITSRGGLSEDPLSTQQGDVTNMVQPAPTILCEIVYDSDGATSNNVVNGNNLKEEVNSGDERSEGTKTPEMNSPDFPRPIRDFTHVSNCRPPIDYTKREANMRMKILRAQLETEKVRQVTELIKKETAQVMLEKAKLELEALKNN